FLLLALRAARRRPCVVSFAGSEDRCGADRLASSAPGRHRSRWREQSIIAAAVARGRRTGRTGDRQVWRAALRQRQGRDSRRAAPTPWDTPASPGAVHGLNLAIIGFV